MYWQFFEPSKQFCNFESLKMYLKALIYKGHSVAIFVNLSKIVVIITTI